MRKAINVLRYDPWKRAPVQEELLAKAKEKEGDAASGEAKSGWVYIFRKGRPVRGVVTGHEDCTYMPWRHRSMT